MDTCPVCLDDIHYNKKITIHNCFHVLCNDCMDNLHKYNTIACPLCRGKINKYSHRGKMYHIIIKNNKHATNNRYYKYMIIQWILLVVMFILLYNVYSNNKNLREDCYR